VTAPVHEPTLAVARRGHLPFAQVSVAIARDPNLTPQAKALYMVLATYADVTTREMFPSRKTLAVDLGLDRGEVSDSADGGRRSITRWTAELRTAGVLRIERRTRGDGSQTSNLYVLLDDELIRPPKRQLAPGKYEQRDGIIRRKTRDDTWP
jgi:Helix-turn-helix domain